VCFDVSLKAKFCLMPDEIGVYMSSQNTTTFFILPDAVDVMMSTQ
jgi:hypothetical protein